MRTTLAVLGVALASAFIIAVGATTTRYTAVVKEMSVLFSGQVIVTSNKAIVIQAVPIGGGMLPQNVTEDRILGVEGIQKTIPILFITPMSIGGTIQPVPINFSMGIPIGEWPSIIGPTPLKGSNGHFPMNETDKEVVIGPSLADQYNWTVGKGISLENHMLRVAGILDTKLGLLNRCILMPLGLAQEIYNYPGSVNIISVTPAQGYTPENLSKAIEGRIDYVQALTEDERNDMIQPVLHEIETWNFGLEIVILVMSLILVMTVSIMSVSERRKDFATLDAIGAPLISIFQIVVFESALIGLIGGLLGIAFGSIIAVILASVYTSIPFIQFLPSISEIVPPLFMLEILGATILVCCAGGLIPALNAARMHIAELLKAEY